jgi:hypothetical protein
MALAWLVDEMCVHKWQSRLEQCLHFWACSYWVKKEMSKKLKSKVKQVALIYHGALKGKAFPLQASKSPWDSRRLRLQNFQIIGT